MLTCQQTKTGGMHLCRRNLGHDDDVVRLYVENVVSAGAFLLCLTSHNAAKSPCQSNISSLTRVCARVRASVSV
jgi:hypothetical protein